MSLEQIISDTLKIDKDNINVLTSPQNCENWTSLKHLLLIKQISKEYNITISIPEIKTLRSVGDIKNFLIKKGVYNE